MSEESLEFDGYVPAWVLRDTQRRLAEMTALARDLAAEVDAIAELRRRQGTALLTGDWLRGKDKVEYERLKALCGRVRGE